MVQPQRVSRARKHRRKRRLLWKRGERHADRAWARYRIREHMSLQFRAEIFNLLNRANFNQPNEVVFTPSGVSPTAGVITSTSTTARQVQFGLKLLWLRAEKMPSPRAGWLCPFRATKIESRCRRRCESRMRERCSGLLNRDGQGQRMADGLRARASAGGYRRNERIGGWPVRHGSSILVATAAAHRA
jgi:hypothetical protein